MNGFARIGSKAALILALAAIVTSPALALDNPWTTTLVSSSGSYSDDLTATVTWNVDHYHYLYELDFQHTYVRLADQYAYPLTVFSVGNTPNYRFTGAGNDAGWVDPIHDPNNAGANSVLWTSATLGRTPVPVGRVVKFWYDSVHAPGVVTVSMTAGRAGGLQTLGMAAVPEPGTFATILVGALGLGGIALRRRSTR